MIIGGKSDYRLNYVYNPVGLAEYRSVGVVMKLVKNKMKLLIQSEDDISPEDLKVVLAGLRKEMSTKVDIDIRRECVIYLLMHGEEFYIDYGSELNVYKLAYTC